MLTNTRKGGSGGGGSGGVYGGVDDDGEIPIAIDDEDILNIFVLSSPSVSGGGENCTLAHNSSSMSTIVSSSSSSEGLSQMSSQGSIVFSSSPLSSPEKRRRDKLMHVDVKEKYTMVIMTRRKMKKRLKRRYIRTLGEHHNHERLNSRWNKLWARKKKGLDIFRKNVNHRRACVLSYSKKHQQQQLLQHKQQTLLSTSSLPSSPTVAKGGGSPLRRQQQQYLSPIRFIHQTQLLQPSQSPLKTISLINTTSSPTHNIFDGSGGAFDENNVTFVKPEDLEAEISLIPQNYEEVIAMETIDSEIMVSPTTVKSSTTSTDSSPSKNTSLMSPTRTQYLQQMHVMKQMSSALSSPRSTSSTSNYPSPDNDLTLVQRLDSGVNINTNTNLSPIKKEVIHHRSTTNSNTQVCDTFYYYNNITAVENEIEVEAANNTNNNSTISNEVEDIDEAANLDYSAYRSGFDCNAIAKAKQLIDPECDVVFLDAINREEQFELFNNYNGVFNGVTKPKPLKSLPANSNLLNQESKTDNNLISVVQVQSPFKIVSSPSRIAHQSPVKQTSPGVSITHPDDPSSTQLQRHVSKLDGKSNLVNNYKMSPEKYAMRRKSGDKLPGPGRPPQKHRRFSEKLKAEASVISRVNELQKEGMWYDKRLPKSYEPPRIKAQWDYLLEEMQWLANDFQAERRWKILASKKTAKIIEKYWHDKVIAERRNEREDQIRVRRIASFIAKEVRNFWSNAKKLVEFKEQQRIEDMRKKALDQHLSFIVDQTEKFSNILAESLANLPPAEADPLETTNIKDIGMESDTQSIGSLNTSDILRLSSLNENIDDDFVADYSDIEDDEETIATAERGDTKKLVRKELMLLKKEKDIPIDKLINSLPKGYLEEDEKRAIESGNNKDGKPFKSTEDDDKDFQIDSSETSDDELETLEEQEKKETEEGGVDHEKELKELEEDGQLPIDELMKKYASKPTVPSEASDNSSETEIDEDEDDDTENDDDGSETDNGEDDSETEIESAESSEEDGDQNLGLATLLKTFAPERAGEEIDDDDDVAVANDVSAMAASFQPKGYTLSSTTVSTKVPFLIKHTLREYQHIGLDWLVTMYKKKLNGILGKTIQTIALIAHLACEKGNWGPHLIVVPTSVMLNWEMEFKKWAPAFKILTYYGSQKERKIKRTGWTKQNSFHVCITSYKLVIQDHQSFRRKRWKYLILDEAQNIKNFKSQRWQLLLNFQSHRRLLLTGTPLQNNLMELWSLMHFLMPNVFQSHREFREWFSNPVTGMVEGSSEYNDTIIKRLHKVLRPFILRRLKSEVEKQLPKKYEHIVMCRLSKRQRFLYEDFMSRTKTRDTLAAGNFLSVINVLMQLRKVCNHPNLFESRPVISPFRMDGVNYPIASLIWNMIDDFDREKLCHPLLKLSENDIHFSKFIAQRVEKLKPNVREVVIIDNESIETIKSIDTKGKRKIYLFTPNLHKNGSKLKYLRKCKKQQVWSDISTPACPKLKFPTPLFWTNVDPSPYFDEDDFVKPIERGSRYGSNEKYETFSDNLITDYEYNNIKEEEGITAIIDIFIESNKTLHNDNKLNSNEPFIHLDTTASTVIGSIEDQMEIKSRLDEPMEMDILPMIANDENKKSSADVLDDNNPLKRPAIKTENDTLSNGKRMKLDSSDNRGQDWLKSRNIETGEFDQPDIKTRRIFDRKAVIDKVQVVNNDRCCIFPIIGSDTMQNLSIFENKYLWIEDEYYSTSLKIKKRDYNNKGYFLLGYSEIISVLKSKTENKGSEDYPFLLKSNTQCLLKLLWSVKDIMNLLNVQLKHFLLYIPCASAPLIDRRVFRPSTSRETEFKKMDSELRESLRVPTLILHPILSSFMTQFPDPRLIQYDCGKLQMLDVLLKKIKVGGHRVLIFTQMAKMLDVLEAFLNYHGHIYLRLDGSTKIDQRQLLMERFNTDTRIFCFILSTRSGGIGVNLTGADTVIFYDSDWNPTMDAQAQDRCHRIGQTRDVNIYRLISEKTIEENILKKSNQKRLLSELAIEGGNFTTAYFKKNTIHELFEVDNTENDPAKRMAEVLKNNEENEAEQNESAGKGQEKSNGNFAQSLIPTDKTSNDEKTSKEKATNIFESALASAEDETDVTAARNVRAEAQAELAEFDESIPLEDLGDGQEVEVDNGQIEMDHILQELTPVEIYALRLVEGTIDDWSNETVANVQKEIEQQKRDWEVDQMRKLEEEMTEKNVETDEEMDEMLTYGYLDSQNQIWIDSGTSECMPLWAPPTPPQDEGDVYFDVCYEFLYSQKVIPASLLPTVYVPIPHKKNKENKSSHQNALNSYKSQLSSSQFPSPPQRDNNNLSDTLSGSDMKTKTTPSKSQRRDEPIWAPRSLFDRATPAIMKMRKDIRNARLNGRPYSSISKTALGSNAAAASYLGTPKITQQHQQQASSDGEWLFSEDNELLSTIQNYLELPPTLLVVNLAQTPNWDLASDVVNLQSRVYRSPKSCRLRYEMVIGPREEGKLLFEPSPPPSTKKSKKAAKALLKLPPQPPPRSNPKGNLKTWQLFTQDNNHQISTMFSAKFDTIKIISQKRSASSAKPMTLNPNFPKISKQSTIFTEHGINYDNPLSATAIAQARYERIQLERKRLIAVQQAQQQQAAAQALQQQQQQQAPGTPIQPNQVVQTPTTVTFSPQQQSKLTVASAPLATSQVANTTPTVQGLQQSQQQQQQTTQIITPSTPSTQQTTPVQYHLVKQGVGGIGKATLARNISNVSNVVGQQPGQTSTTLTFSPQQQKISVSSAPQNTTTQIVGTVVTSTGQIQQPTQILATRSSVGQTTGPVQYLLKQQTVGGVIGKATLARTGVVGHQGTIQLQSPSTLATFSPQQKIIVSSSQISSPVQVTGQQQQVLATSSTAPIQYLLKQQTVGGKTTLARSVSGVIGQSPGTLTFSPQHQKISVMSSTPTQSVITTGGQIQQQQIITATSTGSPVQYLLKQQTVGGKTLATRSVVGHQQGTIQVQSPSGFTQQKLAGTIAGQLQQASGTIVSGNRPSGQATPTTVQFHLVKQPVGGKTTLARSIATTNVQGSPIQTGNLSQQKISLLSSPSNINLTGTPGQGNTLQVQLVKQQTVGGKILNRAVTDAELAQLLKQHGVNQPRFAFSSSSTSPISGKGQITQVQVPSGALNAQILGLQRFGFQVQQAKPIAIVQQATTASQQLQQLQLQQQQQLANKLSTPTSISETSAPTHEQQVPTSTTSDTTTQQQDPGSQS